MSEWDTARGLAAVRAVTRQRFKLLLCNGGFAERGFEHLDHVQELTPAALQHVLSRGADESRHTMLPLGFRIARNLDALPAAERTALRHRLGLPTRRELVVSVAALNRRHKRIDYLISEVARLPEPRPFLLLVGEPEDETLNLRALARELLGEAGYDVRTVGPSQVRDLLRASDLFVLASTAEAQGRAAIEAMSEGLPCLVHDSPVMRFALGEYGSFADFTQGGALATLLQLDHDHRRPAAQARHRFVYERFGWDRLRPQYVRLLRALPAVHLGQDTSLAANSTVSSSTAEAVFRNSW